MMARTEGGTMRSVIYQTFVLPASAETLYGMYLDAEEHAAFTGAPAKISGVPGSAFEAFGAEYPVPLSKRLAGFCSAPLCK